jgi:hypothetical protein
MARKWWTLTIVSIAAFMLLLDSKLLVARRGDPVRNEGIGDRTP